MTEVLKIWQELDLLYEDVERGFKDESLIFESEEYKIFAKKFKRDVFFYDKVPPYLKKSKLFQKHCLAINKKMVKYYDIDLFEEEKVAWKRKVNSSLKKRKFKSSKSNVVRIVDLLSDIPESKEVYIEDSADILTGFVLVYSKDIQRLLDMEDYDGIETLARKFLMAPTERHIDFEQGDK